MMAIKRVFTGRHGFTYWKRNGATWKEGFHPDRHKLSFDSHNTSLPGVGGRSFRIHENVDRDCGFKSKPKPVHHEMQRLSAHSVSGGMWHVLEVRNQVLLRHFEACAPRDLLLF